jgi:hypothetical protein
MGDQVNEAGSSRSCGLSEDRNALGCTLERQSGKRFLVENHQLGGEFWKNAGVRDGLTWRDKFG